MIRKTRYFNKLINFMQKRMKDKCVTGDAKFQIVDRHWRNMLFKWYSIAKAHQDKGMIKILKQVMEVSGPIKDFVLKQYVNQCKFRHAIAFIQWRLYYSGNRKESTAEC